MNISIGDIDLYVLDKGSGPTLLFVHGFPLEHSMWLHQMETFSKTHRVISPDLRGFGKSGVTPHKVTMERFANDLAALLKSLEIDEPVMFCGLSLGGYIAWQFYRLHKRRLARLILCDTRAVGDTADVARGRMIMAARVAEEGVGFIPEAMLPKLFSAETFQHHADVIRRTKKVILGNSAMGIAAAQRGMAERPDMSKLLQEIDIPTLAVCGTNDVISPPSEMRAIASSIPGAQYIEIPQAGHMTPLENPVAFNEALRTFVSTQFD